MENYIVSASIAVVLFAFAVNAFVMLIFLHNASIMQVLKRNVLKHADIWDSTILTRLIRKGYLIISVTLAMGVIISTGITYSFLLEQFTMSVDDTFVVSSGISIGGMFIAVTYQEFFTGLLSDKLIRKIELNFMPKAVEQYSDYVARVYPEEYFKAAPHAINYEVIAFTLQRLLSDDEQRSLKETVFKDTFVGVETGARLKHCVGGVQRDTFASSASDPTTVAEYVERVLYAFKHAIFIDLRPSNKIYAYKSRGGEFLCMLIKTKHPVPETVIGEFVQNIIDADTCLCFSAPTTYGYLNDAGQADFEGMLSSFDVYAHNYLTPLTNYTLEGSNMQAVTKLSFDIDSFRQRLQLENEVAEKNLADPELWKMDSALYSEAKNALTTVVDGGWIPKDWSFNKAMSQLQPLLDTYGSFITSSVSQNTGCGAFDSFTAVVAKDEYGDFSLRLTLDHVFIKNYNLQSSPYIIDVSDTVVIKQSDDSSKALTVHESVIGNWDNYRQTLLNIRDEELKITQKLLDDIEREWTNFKPTPLPVWKQTAFPVREYSETAEEALLRLNAACQHGIDSFTLLMSGRLPTGASVYHLREYLINRLISNGAVNKILTRDLLWFGALHRARVFGQDPTNALKSRDIENLFSFEILTADVIVVYFGTDEDTALVAYTMGCAEIPTNAFITSIAAEVACKAFVQILLSFDPGEHFRNDAP